MEIHGSKRVSGRSQRDCVKSQGKHLPYLHGMDGSSVPAICTLHVAWPEIGGCSASGQPSPMQMEMNQALWPRASWHSLRESLRDLTIS